ncbi:uncharacterized protein LOC134676000 [Cydia fagiglandana]|uniref:uncharacterized protein LOC134676000 n=1 Tax=Cydia fagiglandana TaxID=1458189 RepID=UPI002FEDE5F2
MNTIVFGLIFICSLKQIWCFKLAHAERYKRDADEGVTEFPFAQAKVKYHRSRYCITAFGETNCVRMEEEPGNAAKLAKLYKIVVQGYGRKLGLRTGQNKPSLRSLDAILSQDINMDALNVLIKPQRNQNVKTGALVSIQPRKTNQDTPKISNEIKPFFRELPKKMSQKIELHKYVTQKPLHVAPVPRRSGLLYRSQILDLNFNPERRVGVVGTYPQQKK